MLDFVTKTKYNNNSHNLYVYLFTNYLKQRNIIFSSTVNRNIFSHLCIAITAQRHKSTNLLA